eukprot:TRINITY_DN12048_c0_g1_i1.p1 TRINITY_DN12048_c0_g1~~TRINITY_DN12048_c0_g1_i1.p1  ORF type:complete len:419 (+),score=120.65 TRINITY_DN12048_c0_g1_i1:86-1258(+)
MAGEGQPPLMQRFRDALVERYGSLRGAFSIMNIDALRYDDPSSAVITREELRNGLARLNMQEWTDELLAQLDANGNGVIDLKEFLEGVHAAEGAVRGGSASPRRHGSPAGSPRRGGHWARGGRQAKHWNVLGQNGASVEGWDARWGSGGRRGYDALKRDERGCGAKGCWYCWRGDTAGCRRVQARIDGSIDRTTLQPLPPSVDEPIVPPRPRQRRRSSPTALNGPLSPSSQHRLPPAAWPGGQLPGDGGGAPQDVRGQLLYYPSDPLRTERDQREPPAPRKLSVAEREQERMVELENARAELHSLAADFYRRQARAPALSPRQEPHWQRHTIAERARRVLDEPSEALAQRNWAEKPPPGAHSIAPSVHLLRRPQADPAADAFQRAPWAGA